MSVGENQKGLIIVLSGPAGSGKGTVRAIAERKHHFSYSVSATTRDMRPGEKDGVDYVFYKKETVEEMIREGNMLEYTEYCGNYYGTPKAPVLEAVCRGKDIILEIEVDGAKQVKERYPDAVLIMLLPPSFSVQEQRLRGRGTETEEKIQNRLSRTKEELEYLNIYDYVIYNEDGGAEKAADDFLSIIRSEKCSMRHSDAAETVRERYFK